MKKVDIDIEDFRKNIWLCDEQELNLLKDFYDMLYVNCFDVKNDDMLLECTNIVAEVSICRMTCCEVVQSIPVLKVCNILAVSYTHLYSFGAIFGKITVIEPSKISRSISDRVDYPPIRLSCFGIISVSVRQFSPVSFLP